MPMTPGGRPASTSAVTRWLPTSGVWLAGLNSTVLPKASAGATFQAGIAMGKFQGVMTATTPTGMRWVNSRVPGVAGRIDLAGRLARLAREVAQDGGRPARLADALADGLALFPGTGPGRWPRRAPDSRAAARNRISPRAGAGVAAQAGSAARAAAAAAGRCSGRGRRDVRDDVAGVGRVPVLAPGRLGDPFVADPMGQQRCTHAVDGIPMVGSHHDEDPGTRPHDPARTLAGHLLRPRRAAGGHGTDLDGCQGGALRALRRRLRRRPTTSPSSAPPRSSPRPTSRGGWACLTPRPSASGWSTWSSSPPDAGHARSPSVTVPSSSSGRLRGRVPIALVTNTRRPQAELVLERTGLAGLFDATRHERRGRTQAGARPVPARLPPAGHPADACRRPRGLAHRRARGEGGGHVLHRGALRHRARTSATRTRSSARCWTCWRRESTG